MSARFKIKRMVGKVRHFVGASDVGTQVAIGEMTQGVSLELVGEHSNYRAKLSPNEAREVAAALVEAADGAAPLTPELIHVASVPMAVLA